MILHKKASTTRHTSIAGRVTLVGAYKAPSGIVRLGFWQGLFTLAS
ncbi:hypothetical protein OHJ21_18755 [Virgibacillus sp. LDC1]|nr:hypothetical protein [Virgibacillus sp. LDC1]